MRLARVAVFVASVAAAVPCVITSARADDLTLGQIDDAARAKILRQVTGTPGPAAVATAAPLNAPAAVPLAVPAAVSGKSKEKADPVEFLGLLGIGSDLRTQYRWQGNVNWASPGDVLLNGWKLVRLDDNYATVSYRKRVWKIAFSQARDDTSKDAASLPSPVAVQGMLPAPQFGMQPAITGRPPVPIMAPPPSVITGR